MGGARVEVWAPFADIVEIEVDGETSALPAATADGWFVSSPLRFGTDYAFRLDGGDPRPDPRSRWQPFGVHGPSRLWDPHRFPWTDSGWRGIDLAGAVIYELHLGTFSEQGTFDGAIAHLDHLVDLGASIVELMPVAEFPGERGWGYDGVDLFAAHHAYGGPDGLDRLVDAAHARGLGVMLDVVYNHLGPEGSYLGEFGPYFSESHRTPWGAAMNLDGDGSTEVRRFFIDNARHWLADHHIDGLRLDAVHALVDDSTPSFLAELSAAVDALAAHLGRRLLLVAESETNDPVLTLSRDADGIGLAGQWSDDVHHAIHTALTGEHTGYYAPYRGLHDLAHSMRHAFVKPGERVPHSDGNRFVAFAQNHDHVGNRALGDRLGHQVGIDSSMVAAALVAFAPFTPLLFQGEEWGASTPFCFFADFGEPDLVDAVREGRREEFAAFVGSAEVPDPMSVETFLASRLDWDEPACEPHVRVLAWYRDLLALRREWPELTDGRRDLVSIDRVTEEVLLVSRGRLQLVVALGPDAVVALPDGATILLSSQPLEPNARTIEGPIAVVLSTAR